MSKGSPTTILTEHGAVRYELGDEFVTECEYDEYCVAEDSALADPDPHSGGSEMTGPLQDWEREMIVKSL